MRCGAVSFSMILAFAVVMVYLTKEMLPTANPRLINSSFQTNENKWRSWSIGKDKTEKPTDTKLVLHWTTDILWQTSHLEQGLVREAMLIR